MTLSHPRQKVSSWLSTLSDVAGQNFVLDEDGTCAIGFDASVCFLQVSEEDEQFVLTSPLLAVPEKDPIPFLYQALTLNLFQLPLSGTALAIDSQYNELVLTYAGDTETTDATAFQNILNNFVEAAIQVARQFLQPEMEMTESDQQPAPNAAVFV